MICSHIHLNIYRISFLATFYPKIGLCKKWSPFPNIYTYLSAHVYFSRKLYFQAKLQKLCICQSRASGTHCGGPQTSWTSSLLRNLQFLQPSGSRIRNVKLHITVLLKATWPLSKAFGVLIFLPVSPTTNRQEAPKMVCDHMERNDVKWLHFFTEFYFSDCKICVQG